MGAVTLIVPDKNRSTGSVSEASKTSEVKAFPESKIKTMAVPYVNREIFNIFR